MERRRRLNPVVGKARNLLREALPELLDRASLPESPDRAAGSSQPPLVLVACSGGPDSLALAAAAAYFARTGELQVGAVVVDHQLQEHSTEVAAAAAQALTALGLDPVETVAVTVRRYGTGPEAAARQVRYGALEDAAVRHGAAAVLLGHTLDDQAEQVLLGLARGSGTRSLAGMPARRGLFVRPFLALRRAETIEICRLNGLDPWHDPSNADAAFLRSRVRTEILPFLEERLGPGIAESLHRSSVILAQDADFLDDAAAREYARLAERDNRPAPESEAGQEAGPAPEPWAAPEAGDGWEVKAAPEPVEEQSILLPENELRALPPALRQRVLALAVVELGGSQPSFERLLAAEALLRRRGSAGPIQLAGKVSAYRQSRADRAGGPTGQGKLVLRRSRA